MGGMTGTCTPSWGVKNQDDMVPTMQEGHPSMDQAPGIVPEVP